MQTINFPQRFFLLLLASVLLLPSGAAALDRVRVSYSAINSTQAFLWVAQEKGFFTKHGLEGQLLYINSGSMNIAALVAGAFRWLAAVRSP
jgi:ABC-type nitrate/sulfonate/bicarbonate transport system substrate-binding protein